MSTLLISFATAWLLTIGVLQASRRFAHLAHDHDLTGPQKMHARPVPRIGGGGIVGGVAAGMLASVHVRGFEGGVAWLLFLASLPAFSMGLIEDLTKSVSPRRRLLATAISAAIAAALVHALITRTDVPGLDLLVAMTVGSYAFTIFVVAGVANAFNIIDGFNGLASMCGAIMLAGIAYVAFQVGDATVALLALAGVGAVLGFFLWNFPAGLIFLGDGGAYFIGFYVAEAGILLLARNEEVSPLFPLLTCVYPAFETLFSIYRRVVVRGRPPGMPDGIHLHSLVFKRLMRWAVGSEDLRLRTRRNSMTSPYLWVLCSMSVGPAVLFWNSTTWLACFLVAFIGVYVVLYSRIVRFRTPRWLIFRR